MSDTVQPTTRARSRRPAVKVPEAETHATGFARVGEVAAEIEAQVEADTAEVADTATAVADAGLDRSDEAAAGAASDVEAMADAVADNVTPVLAQGNQAMATQFDTAANQATAGAAAFTADLSEKAKTAMEKSTKLFEEMTDFTKGNVEAIVASGRVAAKGAEGFMQEAAEYGRRSFETAQNQARTLASVKSPTELFQLQSEFAKTAFDAAIAEAAKASENYVKFMSEVMAPISGRVTLAADKLKTAAL